MKSIEKDAFYLAMIDQFLRSGGRNIKDIVPNFDRDKFISFSDTISYMKNRKMAEKALTQIAIDCYKSVSRKFPKK